MRPLCRYLFVSMYMYVHIAYICTYICECECVYVYIISNDAKRVRVCVCVSVQYAHIHMHVESHSMDWVYLCFIYMHSHINICLPSYTHAYAGRVPCGSHDRKDQFSTCGRGPARALLFGPDLNHMCIHYIYIYICILSVLSDVCVCGPPRSGSHWGERSIFMHVCIALQVYPFTYTSVVFMLVQILRTQR